MLDGKVVVVTGAAGGIGRATAERFLARGARVVATDRHPPTDPLPAGTAGSLGHVTGDISVEDDVVAIVDTARRLHGRLDVLVNVAAVTGRGLDNDRDVVAMTLDAWDRVIGVNLRGTMLMCRHAIPLMLDGGGGAIVNVSSKAAVTGNTNLCAYSASKAGVNSLTRTIATSFGQQGIRCNAIMPGIVVGTGAVEHESMAPERLEAVRRHVSVGRLGEPGDVASMAAFLASDDESGYVNGQILTCDGGLGV